MERDVKPLVAAVVLLVAACSGDRDEPGYVVSPGMHFSVPVDPYAKSELTPNGMAMLHPPEGTLQFGAPIARPEENPFAAEPEALRRGKWVYDTFCFVCHGVNGDGDGPVIGAGRFPNPASLTSDKAKALSDAKLYDIIEKGQGLMPGYAVQVQPDDRWRVVLHLRAMQTPPEAP